MTIVSRIKDLCDAKGMTLASLERVMDFGNGTIRKWDNSYPSADKLEKVANYFMVTIDYLLGNTDGLVVKEPSLPLKAIPIIDSLERNSEDIEDLSNEEIAEISKQMEFLIKYAKNKRDTSKTR